MNFKEVAQNSVITISCSPISNQQPSTIATHVNDLHNILKEEKKAAYIILSDGGPDYSPSNLVNSFFTSDSFKN